MKKKISSLIMSIMIICMTFAFAGCSNVKGFYGDWTANSDTWGQFELVINEDGTASASILGIDTTGTWVENEDEGTITVTTEDFEDFDVTAEDDHISFEFSGDTITFDKAE